MFKKILLPLGPSADTKAGINAALTIASHFGSSVTGLSILDTHTLRKRVGPVPLGGGAHAKELTEDLVAEHRTRNAAVVAMFEQEAKAATVEHKTMSVEGDPSDQIVAEAVYHDIIVVCTESFLPKRDDDRPWEPLVEILEDSVTPVLAVPPVAVGEPSRILLAFNGSLPSARALHALAGFDPLKTKEVVILMAADEESQATQALQGAKGYLEAHGFKAVRTVFTSRGILPAISEEWMDWADMVVVGAHSKKGIFGKLLGSLAKYLISENRKRVMVVN